MHGIVGGSETRYETNQCEGYDSVSHYEKIVRNGRQSCRRHGLQELCQRSAERHSLRKGPHQMRELPTDIRRHTIGPEFGYGWNSKRHTGHCHQSLVRQISEFCRWKNRLITDHEDTWI